MRRLTGDSSRSGACALIVAKGYETCAEAWLVIKALDGSFGKATKLNTSKMNLEDWDGAGIWKDAKQFAGDMPRSFTGSLENPVVSEVGRRFLARNSRA